MLHPLVLAALAVAAPAQAGALPANLAECYLQVAATKGTADVAYLVRQMCDDLFAPKRRALFVLDPKSKTCVEWWLDPHGRYETDELLCRFEPSGERKWSLSCQDKGKANRFSFVPLQANAEGGLERAGAVIGEDPGPIFATLRECVLRKAGP